MNDDEWKKIAEKNLGKHLEYINGICAERERIIALLEAEAEFCYKAGWNPGRNLLEAVVTRIKGEN